MAKTGEPLNLSAPAGSDTPGWVTDFADNARRTNDFALQTNQKIGDLAGLVTTNKQSLIGAINEVNGFKTSALDTQEEVEANTRIKIPVGALALKAAISNLKNLIGAKFDKSNIVISKNISVAGKLMDGPTCSAAIGAVETGLAELNSNFKGLPKILTGSKVATYADPTHLNADIDVGAEWNGAYAFFTPIEVIGTVFNAVNSINYKKIINGTLHFTVSGAGFVNGHLLDVAYVLIKL